MEITECLQNLCFAEQLSQIKQKFNKKLLKSEDLYLMTNIEETSYFEVAPPCHIVAHKNHNTLFKNDKYTS